jgi:hypothetical protein
MRKAGARLSVRGGRNDGGPEVSRVQDRSATGARPGLCHWREQVVGVILQLCCELINHHDVALALEGPECPLEFGSGVSAK